MNAHISPGPRNGGFSLIELMIAMTLGLLLTAAVSSLFVGSRQSYQQDEAVTRVQDELRFAMVQMVRDIEMAGFWGELHDPSGIFLHSDLDISKDCGPTGDEDWAYADLTRPISVGDNLESADIDSAFGCITSSEFESGTDVLGLRRVAGQRKAFGDISTSGTDKQHVYLQFGADDNKGELIKAADITAPAPGTEVYFYRHTPVLYYIRNYAVSAGDGVPTLCRKTLSVGSGKPSMVAECVATGVENLQVEVGIDANADGVPDRYLSAPTAAQMEQASTLRISLLVRAETPVPSYQNQKTYTFGNADVLKADDHYYRKLAEATVAIRNPASLRQIN